MSSEHENQNFHRVFSQEWWLQSSDACINDFSGFLGFINLAFTIFEISPTKAPERHSLQTEIFFADTVSVRLTLSRNSYIKEECNDVEKNEYGTCRKVGFRLLLRSQILYQGVGEVFPKFQLLLPQEPASTRFKQSWMKKCDFVTQDTLK
jgi:hypothetical protein